MLFGYYKGKKRLYQGTENLYGQESESIETALLI
jgi:hypothetical protein